MKTHSIKFVLIALLFAFSAACARAELPADAKAAMQKGFDAAARKDYPAAIAAFEEARKIAPDAPDIYYNLGLAESGIPGRELRAIAWFGAYLAANPGASNEKAIRAQIAALSAKNSSNISALIKLYQESFEKGDPNRDQQMKDVFRWRLAALWLKAGDAARAKEEAARLSEKSDELTANIACFQAKQGDVAGALQTAAELQDTQGLDMQATQYQIAIAQWLAGDTAGSDASAALMPDMGGDVQLTNKEFVQQGVAERRAEKLKVPDVSAPVWLKLFEDPPPRDPYEIAEDEPTLNKPYFTTELTEYVRSMRSTNPLGFSASPGEDISNDPDYVLEMLKESIEKIIEMSDHINQMIL